MGCKKQIPRTLEDWPSQHGIRRTSINNFGYGGANSHVILEEAAHHLEVSKAQVNGHRGDDHDGRKLFVLSARDEAATRRMAENLCQYLTATSGHVSFRDLAYTLGQRRSRLSHTLFATAGSAQELAEALSDRSVKPVASSASTTAPRLGFVFNGQGAQWYGMGRELMAQYPTFLKSMQDCDAIIQDFGADWSLLGKPHSGSSDSSLMHLMGVCGLM
jgi:acyl transferase domain-containing protein